MSPRKGNWWWDERSLMGTRAGLSSFMSSCLIINLPFTTFSMSRSGKSSKQVFIQTNQLIFIQSFASSYRHPFSCCLKREKFREVHPWWKHFGWLCFNSARRQNCLFDFTLRLVTGRGKTIFDSKSQMIFLCKRQWWYSIYSGNSSV